MTTILDHNPLSNDTANYPALGSSSKGVNAIKPKLSELVKDGATYGGAHGEAKDGEAPTAGELIHAHTYTIAVFGAPVGVT